MELRFPVRFLICAAALFGSPVAFATQARRAPSSVPQIDVQHYAVQARLNPDEHEVAATASVTFKALEKTDVVLFELSDNLSVQKITTPDGIEVEFGQDESGPGTVSVRFAKLLEAGSTSTIRIEYTGGFDRDRYSRNYSRDESSAYVGPEGSYLLYGSKWFPVHKFLVDRATADIEVTVPLGFTVVGPGTQLPVVTKGITEIFGWTSKTPILPNSFVAARYFEKSVSTGGITVDCFAREDHVESIQKQANVLGKILDYYDKTFGAPAAGRKTRLVEVDDRLTGQNGMLGTVFVTHRELSEGLLTERQLARRAAYQWWMETIGVQHAEDLWLIDGMSYYSSALYLGKTVGPPAFKEELEALAVLALKFESRSAVRTGIGLGYRSEPYQSVVAGKGAWTLHMLRHLLGETKFADLIRQYVKEYTGRGGSTAASARSPRACTARN